MLGPEAVVDAVAAAFRAGVPVQAPLLAARLGVPADAVPVPRPPDPEAPGDQGAYFTEDRARVDEDLPALIVTMRRTRTVRPVDPTLGDAANATANRYLIRYVIRTLGFAEGDGFADTSRRRHRLALLTREILLTADLGAALGVDPTTVTEDYSDVGLTEQSRYLAGFWLECDVVVEEELQLPTSDVVHTTQVTAHPALD